MSVELIENIDYEIKETLEDLISQMKTEIFEVLDVIKFLIRHNQFKCAHNVLLSDFQEATIGNYLEKILDFLKRINNESN